MIASELSDSNSHHCTHDSSAAVAVALRRLSRAAGIRTPDLLTPSDAGDVHAGSPSRVDAGQDVADVRQVSSSTLAVGPARADFVLNSRASLAVPLERERSGIMV